MRIARRLVLGLPALLAAAGAGGQTVHVTGATSLRYIELRPFARDSVSEADVAGEGLLRQLPDGSVVRCIAGDGWCYQVRPGDRIATVPMIHDIGVSAWGFGPGLRLAAQLRGRTSMGDNAGLWPRGDDHLEVLALYGEMERGSMRGRLGRQWRVSGLGFYNFDGLSLAMRRGPSLLLEAYGGRSLSRGLNEPRTGGALESIEDLGGLDAGLLLGVQARYRPGARLQVAAAYQMDLRGDRRGAYAELFSSDALLRLGGASVEGSVEVDVAGRALNHARLLVRTPPRGRLQAFGEVRRYRPYFELWTIWGAFSPVGFDEARTGLTWAGAEGRLLARAEGSYRRYDAAETDAVDAFREDGWGAGGSLAWLPDRRWHVDVAYRVEGGFGAARAEGSLSVRREASSGAWVALHGTGFQRLYEFRLGEGTVFGGGAEASGPVGDRGRWYASAMVYRQRGGLAAAPDWNQRRASVRLEWMLGGEADATREAGASR